ncbi:uncharacterized protein LOC107882986 [Acyrthosiphon pisum]|uniref:DUF7802 domain-containing protein n=1 Tax=Acyrthosiphon pisum TaxID=7029 RepID=A0A8R2NWV5_ACYPI|nr:uncharacterized protein LOC107882986 [Acyrthosiphon pisum]
MILYLTVYYTTFLCLAIWGKPENEISIGPHEEIGPCNITVSSFGTNNLFRHRLPLYVIILYSVFYYIAIEIAYRTNKTKVGFIVTVGLNVFLIDLPYDIMGIKFVHWTWHDTDPNIEDRMYWVPWTSYYFHMVFSANFVFWFFIIGVNLDQTYTSRTEILTSLKAIFLSTPCGILCFSVLYHPLHDLNDVPTQTITVFLISCCLFLNANLEKSFNVHLLRFCILLCTILHFCVLQYGVNRKMKFQLDLMKKLVRAILLYHLLEQ